LNIDCSTSDHIEARGCDLFRVACERDVEGIVAKLARGTYRTDGRTASWLKIKNREYTQSLDRHELFVRQRVSAFRSERKRCSGSAGTA
jgi:ATP-dependent DNA ligase